MTRDQSNGLKSLSTDGAAKEGRPKFNSRPGIEPRTSWLAVRDLTNCANLARGFVCYTFLNSKTTHPVVRKCVRAHGLGKDFYHSFHSQVGIFVNFERTLP